MVVQIWLAMRFWHFDSWLGATASTSGGDRRNSESKLEGKNPRFGLNLFCREMALLKVFFCECGQSPMWKLIMVLAHCSFVGGVDFGEERALVLSWWCLVRSYKKIDHYSEPFCFCIFFSFFLLYASVLPLGNTAVVETKCNLYLRDINIFPLTKNETSLHAWSELLSILFSRSSIY
jgi:hypothetical protein